MLLNKILVMIPSIIKQNVKYILSRKAEFPMPDGKRVLIFLAADYGNLGDVAITYAQCSLLKELYPNHEIVEVPASCDLARLKYVLSSLKNDDVVSIIGGGNMGDLWPPYEMLRQMIVSRTRHLKTISFPQTATYTNSARGRDYLKSAKRIYRGDNLVLLARERLSLNFMRTNFNVRSELVPDIVMTLRKWTTQSHRTGIKTCIRNDREKFISKDKVEKMFAILSGAGVEVSHVDTHIGNDVITMDNKYSLLEDFLSSIASSQLLVTDRLHGMIFAYITGTPAIVLPNSNKKVEECYQWISDCGFIHFMNDFDVVEFSKKLHELIECQPDIRYLESKRNEFVRRIKNLLQ